MAERAGSAPGGIGGGIGGHGVVIGGHGVAIVTMASCRRVRARRSMQYSARAMQLDLKCEFVPCTRDCVRAILRARKCSCPAGAARRLGSPRLPKRQLPNGARGNFRLSFGGYGIVLGEA